jgi:hypothetical protein
MTPETTATVAAVTHPPSKGSDKVITMELCFPRIILSQFNKHGSIRSNTSSSRAIPVVRATEIIDDAPYIPPVLYKNRKGMSGKEKLEGEGFDQAQAIIREIYEFTKKKVLELEVLKVHKQHANRYLEPFSMVKVIATGSSVGWRHLLDMRSDIEQVQPEFVVLANAIKAALLPYANGKKHARTSKFHVPWFDGPEGTEPTMHDVLYACGRAARTSYMREDVSTDFMEKLQGLWDDKHLTPFEHVLYAAAPLELTAYRKVPLNPITVAEMASDVFGDWDGRVLTSDILERAYDPSVRSWAQLRHIGLGKFRELLEGAK